MHSQDDLRPRYPMNRRTFVNMVAAGAAALFSRPTPPLRSPRRRPETSSLCTGCSPTGQAGPR